MFRRCLGFAALMLVAVACVDCILPPGVDGGGGGSSDAGLTATTTAKLLGKWGSLLSDGSGDPNNAYYFANGGGWGLVQNGSCTAGDAYSILNDIMTVRVGSTQTDYQVSFLESGAVLNLRTPGAVNDGGGSSTPQFVFRLLDQKTNHSCSNL